MVLSPSHSKNQRSAAHFPTIEEEETVCVRCREISKGDRHNKVFACTMR